MNRCTYLPPLDDWKDGQPDIWDYEAVLKANGVTVQWHDHMTRNSRTYEPMPPDLRGWGFHWPHGSIHIGQCSKIIARKAATLFVSLWLRGVSASFCDKIMSGMIWFWELQERPQEAPVLDQLSLAKLFHETYERLAPDFGYTTRPETHEFDSESPNGRLMIAVCGEILKKLKFSA